MIRHGWLLAWFALAACDLGISVDTGGFGSFPIESSAGAYLLRQVNDRPLPTSLGDADSTVVISGWMNVRTDPNTWEELLITADSQSLRNGGTYTDTPEGLRMRAHDGRTFYGRIVRDTFVYTLRSDSPAVVLTFVR